MTVLRVTRDVAKRYVERVPDDGQILVRIGCEVRAGDELSITSISKQRFTLSRDHAKIVIDEMFNDLQERMGYRVRIEIDGNNFLLG